MSKDVNRPPVREVTEGDLWQALIADGATPREAKLQCRLAFILGSEIKVGDAWLTLSCDKESPASTLPPQPAQQTRA